MFQRLPWLTALAVWLVLYSIPATGEGLTLQQALDRALADNPTVEAEIARAESLRQQGVIDKLPPAWQVTADFEQFAGTGSLRGLRGAETTIRLGRQFELGGKRASRIALADARVAAQEHEQRLSRLDLEALVTQRF
ncbi:MAG: TolC family protein, partial [Steroidobacteraceae bacterium]